MHLDTFRSYVSNDGKAFEGTSEEPHTVCRPWMGFVQQPTRPFHSLSQHSDRNGGVTKQVTNYLTLNPEEA